MSSRGKKLKTSIIMGLIREVVTVMCGLILPRFILSHFGSAYNGIINSVTQLMGFSIVFRSGLSAVTNAALYKPLAENDNLSISRIMVATKSFMNKVGGLLILFILGFAAIYPLIVADEFGYWFSFSLAVIIGASSFVENMFSIKYKILLEADQRYYVQTLMVVIARALSTVFSVLLILLGCGIHIVKIGGVLGLLTTPIMLKIYVDHHYNINWNAPPDNTAIKARWDAFAQQMANIFNSNAPTIVMTLMLPLKEISVYSVYNMVSRNLVQLITGCLAGVKATFGNMIARGERKTLQERFSDIELLTYTCGTIIFVTTAILITPFVLLYTKNITDVDYNRYWLGICISLVSMMTVLRIPYQLLVEAAGIFKETRNGAFLEIFLNIGFSVLFVHLFGIIGVVAGGFISAIVRTTQFAIISHKKVLQCSVAGVIKNYLLYFAIAIGLVALANRLDCFACASFGQWILMAILVFTAVTAIVMVFNLLFKFKQCKSITQYLLKSRK